MLINKIKNRESGIVLYGITPPAKGTSPDKLKEIATQQLKNLHDYDIDGLIIYDIQDEESITGQERPFPFQEKIDSFEYSNNYLWSSPVSKVIYRVVGKYTKTELSRFISKASAKNNLAVFVGAPLQYTDTTMSLDEAYELRKEIDKNLSLGGVMIPERHDSKGDEHNRVFYKMSQDCTFFVSQGVYNVEMSKNFLSEYYYHGQEHNIPLAPMLFTLTPCGSVKTLNFMKWLGISVPTWVENELLHADDILQKSIELSEQSWLELKNFADEKGIPIGCHIESVTHRKVEIEASIELLKLVSK